MSGQGREGEGMAEGVTAMWQGEGGGTVRENRAKPLPQPRPGRL